MARAVACRRCRSPWGDIDELVGCLAGSLKDGSWTLTLPGTEVYGDEDGSRSLASTSLQESAGSGDGDVGVVDRVHHMHLHEEGIRGKVRRVRVNEEGKKGGSTDSSVNNGRCQLQGRL